jgi:hypothetical protein
LVAELKKEILEIFMICFEEVLDDLLVFFRRIFVLVDLFLFILLAQPRRGSLQCPILHHQWASFGSFPILVLWGPELDRREDRDDGFNLKSRENQ